MSRSMVGCPVRVVPLRGVRFLMACRGRLLLPRAHDSIYNNVDGAVQLLHRFLHVVLWLEQHARVCSGDVQCTVCAFRRSREGIKGGCTVEYL